MPLLTKLFVLLTLFSLNRAEGELRTRWISQALAEVMTNFSPESQTNPECSLHSQLYLQGLQKSTLWAVQMLDSSSMTVGGLLTGDIYSLGHMDQCVSVNVPQLRLRGQHCLATLQYAPNPQAYPLFYTKPNATYKEPPPTASVWDKVKVTEYAGMQRRDVFHWAVCVPASCTAQDIQDSLNSSLDSVFSRSGLVGSVTVDPAYCNTAEDDQEIVVTSGYVLIRIVLTLYILVSIIATCYDYIMPYYKDQKAETALAEISEKLLLAFSLRRNMNELTEKGSNPKLDFINGGKVISICAILFGHRALYSHGLALFDRESWELRYEQFGDMALMNATFLVDVFFTSSGFLAFLGLYKTLEKNKSVNFLLIIFLRWVRIVPPYLLMMGIYGWVLPYMSEGPLWNKKIGLEAQRCRDNWWVNLLFINNYYHADNQCLLLSWYLACDMQMFVVGIFVMYVLWRWRKIGYVLLGSLLTASILIPAIVTYTGKYTGIMRLYASSLLNDPGSNDHYANVYVKTHNRFGPYIIGVLTAYLSIRLTEANYKFSKRVILFGFILFFGGGFVHQFYGSVFYLQDRPYSGLENALYAGLHRISFSLGVAWIGVTYYTTGFGLFRVLLGQPIYTPLCRLIYCLVLIHPAVQLAESASVRHSEHMSYSKMFWMACGDYLVALLLSLPLYLMAEAPFRTIVKIIFLDRRPSTSNNKSSQNATSEPVAEPKVVISKL